MKKFGSVDLHVESGKATLEMRAKRQRETFVRRMAALLSAWFIEKQGRNYVEVELSAPPLTEQIPPGWERCIGPLILTVQRRDGQTPHQLRAKAEAERDALLAQAQESNVIKVYPAYAGGHDPLNLVAAWNTLHPDTPLVVVDDAFEVCQAYLVTGAAYETAQATLRGLPDRPVIWLDDDRTTAVFADRAGFVSGQGALFADVFPHRHTPLSVIASDDPVLAPNSDELHRAQIIAAARAQYEHEGSVEIDDHAAFSRGADDGLYVAAWVWVSQEPDGSDEIAYEDMSAEQLAEIKGSYSVDDGPAGEFDNLLDAINACAAAAKANSTFSHVYEHHHGGRRYEVWEVDGLFCSCDHETVTHTEGQWRDCGEMCDECGQPLPPERQP